MQRDFNGLGQLITEYQAHSGAVNTGTTPKLQYAYTEMAGGANHSRLVSMTYPNGRVLNYNYSTGLNDSISRLSSLSDTSATLESLDYLGLGTVVRRAHPQPGVDQTYIKQSGESNGDAGDQYTGLDRFGRVVDQRWRKTSDGSHTDRFGYGYDRDSNRKFRENLIDAVFSELYDYDGLNQLTSFDRGTLNATKDGIVGTPSRSQDWDFDALGNFDKVTTDGSAQTRSHNKQNQITSILGLTTPAYDANSNMTTDQAGKSLVYDAWNRQVAYKDGANTLVSHAYDALNRRITENAGTARALFYSSNWQVVEERESGLAVVQHVWSPVYVDAMVLRDRDADGNGSLEERLYALHDANFNISALINASGTVLERFIQDVYGQFSVLAPDWSARVSSLYEWVYLHQGGRHEAASGQFATRTRWFLPALGRFEKPDLWGFGAGDANLYRFVGNRPTSATDPFGLQAMNPVRPKCCSGKNCKWNGDWEVLAGGLLIGFAEATFSFTGTDDTGCVYTVNGKGRFDQNGMALGIGHFKFNFNVRDAEEKCEWPIDHGRIISAGTVGAGGAAGIKDPRQNNLPDSGLELDGRLLTNSAYGWWRELGWPRYRGSRRVLITADCGGSNAPRTRLWQVELQKLADATGLIVAVCHYPPGTSKWNKIEHRLFCHITRNWQGRPLETAEVVVESINHTTTETGLEVHAWLDENVYEKGRKVSDEELAECRIKRHKYHGEWNYEIHPRKQSKMR